MRIDLNCDLGEGEPLRHTRALMRHITSANIACGGHAGTVASMTACVRLAKQHRVHIGAHPGAPNGRGDVAITPEELELLLLQQVSVLEQITRRERARLHHIKLHGTLYHLTDSNPSLAKRYLTAVQKWWPSLIIYARADGRVVHLAQKLKLRVWPEAFADRRYRPDGTLAPRSQPNALITSAAKAATQAQHFLCNPHIRTLCVHSDTPNALLILQTIANLRTQT